MLKMQKKSCGLNIQLFQKVQLFLSSVYDAVNYYFLINIILLLLLSYCYYFTKILKVKRLKNHF